MIRYFAPMNAWISGKNTDDHGMPTTDLRGDDKLCTCADCYNAWVEGLGTNVNELHGENARPG